MARKKSAAKKAREAELKASVVSSDTPVAETPVEKPKIEKPQLQAISDDEEEEESSEEEEDEYGELATANIDTDINKILLTLKTDPKKLLDKDLKFFEETETNDDSGTKKEKPMYLKDYHRMNLLSGDYKNNDEDEQENEYGTVDGEKPFVVTEREERNQLLSDIKNAFNDEDEEGDDDDGDFLKKKDNSSHKIKKIQLPDPEKNQEDFLKTFLDNKAWIPTKSDKVINLDRTGEDDEEFDHAVDEFENAYNFRYEDPRSAEIVSYARNQATLRRDKTNARKRQREMKLQEKEEELKQREEKLKKKETAKLNKAIDRMTQIREAVGNDVSEEVIQKVFGDSLLSDDFDDADWDSKMAEIFNEQYYNEDTTKPEWSDMEDIQDEEDEQDQPEEKVDEEAEEPPAKKSKKDKLKDKKSAKKEKQSIKEKAKKLVESNKAQILEEIQEEEERGRSKDEDVKFKYREISPETYGLTNRDILLADDKQLNSYIGIRKLAPYRPKELRTKDRRKYKKKRPLEEWRKDALKHYKPQGKDDDENTIWIEAEGEKKSKDKKHKHSHSSKHK